MVSLKEELEQIPSLPGYRKKVRFGNRLQYEFEVNEICENFSNSVLCFCNHCSKNAIKHGVYESTEEV